MATSPAVFTEDEFSRRWDRCFTDFILKLGGGAFLGSLVSLMFFKRKRWPILLGSGFAVGMAYSNCERDINTVLRNATNPDQCPPVAE